MLFCIRNAELKRCGHVAHALTGLKHGIKGLGADEALPKEAAQGFMPVVQIPKHAPPDDPYVCCLTIEAARELGATIPHWVRKGVVIGFAPINFDRLDPPLQRAVRKHVLSQLATALQSAGVQDAIAA